MARIKKNKKKKIVEEATMSIIVIVVGVIAIIFKQIIFGIIFIGIGGGIIGLNKDLREFIISFFIYLANKEKNEKSQNMENVSESAQQSDLLAGGDIAGRDIKKTFYFTPDNKFKMCPKCKQMTFEHDKPVDTFKIEYWVCRNPECGYEEERKK